MQIIRMRSLVLLAMVALVSVMAGCGGGDNAVPPVVQTTTENTTLNPVLDFYINRTMLTDTIPPSLWGYGVDGLGTFTDGHTGSETGTSGGRPYQNFFKLLYNFNIAALQGTTVKSAYFQVYMTSVGGVDSPQNAVLENIFYGNTDSFPPAPRNYDNEFGGNIVTPAITDSISVSATGWKSFDVTAKLQADINEGRSNSQFRLSHENDSSLLNYSCDWNMADNVSNKPQLVITYTK